MAETSTESEFSHPVLVNELGEDEMVIEIEADTEERVALANRFGLLALDRLAATVRLKRVDRESVRFIADFAAEVVQACVVTLEPVAERIEDRVELLFSPPASSEVPVVVVRLGDDEPEPLGGEAIDVGEIVAEHLGIALNPYPRRRGAVFTGLDAGAGDDGAVDSPFAALQDRLRDG